MIDFDTDISVDDFPQIPNNSEHYGARTSHGGYLRGKFTSRVEKFLAGEALTAGDPVFMTQGIINTVLEATALSWYTRPTTAGSWTEQGSRPTTFYNSSATHEEVGFKLDSGSGEFTCYSVSFTADRGSGSSGGTNYGRITARVYEVDGSGDPVASSGVDGEVTFNTWATNPADFKITFSTPLEITNDSEFVISIQYDTTDTDNMTISNISTEVSLIAGRILKSDPTNSGKRFLDGIVTEDASKGGDVWVDVSEAFSGITGQTSLVVGQKYYVQSDNSIATTVSELLIGMAYNTSSIMRPEVSLGSQELIVSYSSSSSFDFSKKFDFAGFVYGLMAQTGDDVNLYLNDVSMGTARDPSSGSTNTMNYCIPVNIGDIVNIESSDGMATMYFKKLSR